MSAPLSALARMDPQEMVAQSLSGAVPGPGREHNAEAAKKFEGMVMEFLFQSMEKTVQPSGLFGEEGTTRSTYEYLLNQAVTSKAMDAGKGLGLSQRLESDWNARWGKPLNRT